MPNSTENANTDSTDLELFDELLREYLSRKTAPLDLPDAVRRATRGSGAPRSLVTNTIQIRDAFTCIREGLFSGCCGEAAALLTRILQQRGADAQMTDCWYAADALKAHAYCRVGHWGLDPTREQFDGRAPLVFDLRTEHGYADSWPSSFPSSDSEFVGLLAVFARDKLGPGALHDESGALTLDPCSSSPSSPTCRQRSSSPDASLVQETTPCASADARGRLGPMGSALVPGLRRAPAVCRALWRVPGGDDPVIYQAIYRPRGQT